MHPNRMASRLRWQQGFTLAEVIISLGIAGLVFGGILAGYMGLTNRAQWSAYSLAAQSLATQGVEQARAAKWDPQAYPPIDETGLTNFAVVEQLDVPVSVGNTVYATNYISISAVSAAPPLRQLKADCVWILPSRAIRTVFTNTAITLRAPDQ
jgi:prepilin-type N-terminal cleavage/methylation domain-containing protein